MTKHTDIPLYRSEQVRELDALSADAQGIASCVLMQSAGLAAFSFLTQHWPNARRILILAGPGNNGGDGYSLGLECLNAGFGVQLLQISELERIGGDAGQARAQFLAAGGVENRYDGIAQPDCDVLIDALFGTGLNKPLAGMALNAVLAINQHAAPVLALDIPSGLNSDTGMPMNETVIAQHTLTFVARKQGLYTGMARNYCGQIAFDTLGTRDSVYERMPPAAHLIGPELAFHLLPPRHACAHKGEFGHALIIGGDLGMGGAARLAGEAALRCGAGRVSLATRESHASQLIAGCPSLMSRGVETLADLELLLAQTSVLAIGPGLGVGDWGLALLSSTLKHDKPMVLDADALNLLAAQPTHRNDWILTPHPAEAARLLACSTADIQADRYAAARELQQRYGGTIVLKGAGSIVQSANRTAVCPLGNPGMATAGMGDVLTGIIAALLAQGLAATDAAELGVVLHAQAGDLTAAEGGERGMIASDLFTPLRRLINT